MPVLPFLLFLYMQVLLACLPAADILLASSEDDVQRMNSVNFDHMNDSPRRRLSMDERNSCKVEVPWRRAR